MNHHSSLGSIGHCPTPALPCGRRDGGDLPPCDRARSQEPRPALDAENGGAVKVRPEPALVSAISIPPILRRSGSVAEAELPTDSRTMRTGQGNYHASMMNLF
ncbi:hypothetical protein SSPO_052520 [Streptomyces antimycoticus]|uniref:Uncharacterized protein n=1 Tax=Streptomyces antimycoticus TaxID=68175 RepID=A0A499UL71_9ACTN|nr:hypothetical protein SSPO_052520 [Streptomyces antimycoticus]